MDIKSFIKSISHYNNMVTNSRMDCLEKVSEITITTLSELNELVKINHDLGIDNDGAITISLSNPYKLDMYEEVIVKEDKLYVYRENLATKKIFKNIEVSMMQAKGKIDIYNNVLHLLDVFRNKTDISYINYLGNELFNYININSTDYFIIDFTGVDKNNGMILLNELVRSCVNKNFSIKAKLESIVLLNAGRDIVTEWNKYVSTYEDI